MWYLWRMDLYVAQLIAQIGQGTWIDDLSFMWSRWLFLSAILWIIVIASLFADKKTRKQYLIALCIWTVLFYLCNEIVFKHVLTDLWWMRLRPYLAHPHLFQAIGSQIFDSSFPSSHTAGTVTILTLWVMRQKKLRWIALCIGLLVALSRIHNGMHYPSDVLAGALFGMIYAYRWIQSSKLIVQKRPSLK